MYMKMVKSQLEHQSDEKDPIQLESGELGCPDCKVQLVSGNLPMYFRRIFFGYFDGLKCTKCDYGLLTEKGYEDSGNVIKHYTQQLTTGNATDLYFSDFTTMSEVSFKMYAQND